VKYFTDCSDRSRSPKRTSLETDSDMPSSALTYSSNRHRRYPALHEHRRAFLHHAARVRHLYPSHSRTPRRQRRAGNGVCARPSTMPNQSSTRVYPMRCRCVLVSDPLALQKDAQTRSHDRETGVVGRPPATARRQRARRRMRSPSRDRRCARAWRTSTRGGGVL
jgi:hypothetical protein